MGIVSSKRKFIIALAILIVAQLAAYTFLGFQKQDYHIDEYSTYQYANSDSIWWSIPQGEWTSPDYLLKQMLVDSPEEKFQYGDIIRKQADDLHPFLYSWTINTVCSLWPGEELSPWQGLAVNFIPAAGLTVLSAAIVLQIEKNRKLALLAAAVTAFSFGIVDMVMFIRMYTQLMFWTAALCLIHLKYWEKRTPAFYVLMFAVSVCGTLTQYHFLIFLFFSCLYFGVRLLVLRRWKEAALYAGTEAAAGGFTVLVFPPIIGQLFQPHGSTEIADTGSLPERIWNYFSIAARSVWGGALWGLIAVLILAGAVWFLVRSRGRRPADEAFWGKLGQLAFPVVPFFVFLGASAPYYTSRYVAILFPALIVVALVFLHRLFGAMNGTRRTALVLTAALAGVITVFPYTQQTLLNLYSDRVSVLESAAENSQKKVVAVSPYDWLIPYDYCEIAMYDEFIWVTPESLQDPDVQALLPQEDFMLYVFDLSGNYEAAVEQVEPMLEEIFEGISIEEAWTTRVAEVYYCAVQTVQ